ncbi:ATP-binding protein [Nibricoccus sp. IMCC34717]|uniref:ATP-binding protein n=1 Tax=Nibricoccus sp. IMCC34717 TaxID=3034021 RepID=UPI00384DE3C9
MTETPPPLVLGSELRELARLEPWVNAVASAAGANERDRFRLDLALTEAVTNVLMHGKPAGDTDAVLLSAEFQDRDVVVTVSDQGASFDPLAAPLKTPAASLDEAVPGGAGLTLIRAYCDNAEYKRSGGRNHLTLHFRLGAS